MRCKKIMILTIILAFLLAISAVSAADNVTSDVVNVEETTDEVVSVENNNQVIAEGNDSEVGTFADLETEINNVEEGGVLNLTKDYKYVNGSTEGISINKHIIIEGNNYVIDGNFQSRIFTIYSDGVTLKNLKIVGGVNWIGGAIYSSGQNLNVINCTFENNIAKETTGGDGGAIYISGKNSYVINCTFVNCSAECGGAILWSADYGNLINSRFYKCFVFRDKGDCEKQGAALRWEGNSAKIFNCSFINNFITGSVIASGGGIYIRNSDNSIISNCSFINNTCGVAAGMNIEYCNHVSISNSIFKNNFNSRDGGCTIFSYEWTNGLMFNCSFVNNSDVNNIGLLSSSVIINNSFFDPDSDISVYENIVLIKKVSKLSHGDCIFVYGDSKAFWVLLRTEDNIILINKTIIFKFMEFDYQFKVNTNNEGIAEIDELNDLAVGIWNVSVIFEGTGNYAPCNATATITVLPSSSSVTIEDFNTTVGHEVTLVANVNSTLTVNEGVVTFFDGENSIGEANVVGGVATLTYTPSTAGEHTITAIFNSDNYGSSNDTALLTVSKADVDLSIDYITDVYFTNPSNFAVNVNSNYKPVNEGKVKYYVNNELVGTVDVYGGNANFNYVTGTTGSFTLTATYEETDNYFAKNASASFNVNKMPTTLSGESVIFDEESYKTFTTELKDNNNNGVGDQPVKIEVIKYSGESATFNGISDANGITIYDVGRLAGGMWYVTGIYAGNNNYINSRFVDKFIVVRMNTTTEIEEIDNPKVNHNYKLKANIHDENGKLVKEGVVQFYLDGIDIGSIDLSKNQGHQNTLGSDVLGAVNPMFEYVVGANDVSDLYLNYVPKKAGKHTLTAVYEGTTIYKASNSTTSFDVSNSNTVETSIVASDVSTVYNGGKYIVIKLKDVNGKAVSGVKVTVVLGGKTFTPTTKNGQAKVSTNGLVPVKTYKATITFKGNSKYDKSTTTAKVVVKKATPKITAKAKTFKKSVKTKKYTVTLKTNQNKVMKNTKLTLKVNGKTYKATTNTKGQATFKITKLTKKGKFTAVVKFAGNKYYNAKTVKPKITVK